MNIGKDGMVYYCRMTEQSGWNGHEIAVRMLKQGFRDFFQTDFREGAIQKHEYGKPYYGVNPNLKFNISHCKDGVAVVLSEREVGVDIESMRRVKGRTVKKCCSREEISYVYGEGEDRQKEMPSVHSFMSEERGKKEETGDLEDEETRRFLNLWTLKESYVKMTGEGLRTSFDQICFLPTDLQKARVKEAVEIKGIEDVCRHYLYFVEDLTLAVTALWKERDREPNFAWKRWKPDDNQ